MKYINFETGYLREIKNSRYVSIYCKIIELLEQAEFKHKHMSDCIGLLTRHGITIEEHWKSTKYKETPEIQELHKERRKRLASLRDLIDKLDTMKGFVSESSALLLQSWFKTVRSKIGSRNTLEEMKVVNEIELSADFYKDLHSAMDEANMLHFIEELIKLNNEIIELEVGRQEHYSSSALGKERKLKSYRDLNMVLQVLNSVIEKGEKDSELAEDTGGKIQALLRRERGYVRMVDTKKQNREEKERGEDEERSHEEDRKTKHN